MNASRKPPRSSRKRRVNQAEGGGFFEGTVLFAG